MPPEKGGNKSKLRKKLIVDCKIVQRIDVFVTSKLRNFPRKKIQAAILKGKIKLNDKKVKPKTYVRKNDQISIELELDSIKTNLKSQPDIEIQIIEENDDFIIINKPAGISVHPGDHEHEDTVVNWALAHFPQIKNVGENPLRPGIVHRLDKETSGILIIVKNQKSFKHFKQLFSERKIKKTYFALCWGSFQKNKGQISTFIGKSNSNPLKQATSANAEKLINPKKALTSFEVVEQRKEMSLIRVSPKTGRKHQIRIHLQSIGHPIVGDKIYNTKNFQQDNKKHHRLMLHAQKIEFYFPPGKRYSLESDLPKDFKTK